MSPVYSYAYDASGNQTLLRDPLGHETRFTFDAEGRQISRQLPLAFGVDGRAGTADDAEATAFAETFEYDAFGRPSRHVSFEGVVKRSEYDPATGRLTVEEFFDNPADEAANNPAATVSYSYDASGRVVRQTRVAGELTEVWSWSFDAEGRVTRAVSPTGTIGYEYDALGRKTRTWASDAVDQAVPDSSFASDTRYEYDALGRLSMLRVFRIAGETLPGTEIPTTRYEYDLAGRLVRQTNPNGTIALHEYDTLGRLTKLTHYAPDATPRHLSNNAKLAEFDDTHNTAGQRTSTTETFWFDGDDAGSDPEPHTSHIDWTYDNAGRLVDELFNHYDDTLDQTQHFGYELAGNRLSRAVDEGSNNSVDQFFAYEYDANDRLTLETELHGRTLAATTARTYLQTQETARIRSNGAGTVVEQWAYLFDSNGHLAEATGTRTGEATSRVAYSYDESGLRYRSVTSTANPASGEFSIVADTRWLNDNANFTGHEQAVRETVQNAAGESIRSRDFTFGLSLVAQSTKDVGNAPVDTLAFHADALGSTRALSDEAGSLGPSPTSRVFSYTAGGEAAGFDPGTAPTTVLYTQQPWDASLGLQYNRARYLDLATGRFLGLDPFAGDALNPQSYNKYLYVQADPVNGIDPTGLYTSAGSVGAATIGTGFNATSAGTIVASKVVTEGTLRTIGLFTAIRQSTAMMLVGGTAVTSASLSLPLTDQFKMGTILELKFEEFRTKQKTRAEIDQRRRENPNKLWFVHGTNSDAWSNGPVDPLKGNKREDFGQGFYCFEATIDGVSASTEYATRKASSKDRGKASNQGLALPFLLIFSMERSVYEQKNAAGRILNYGTRVSVSPQWGTDVNAYRRGWKPAMSGFDIMVGPTARLNTTTDRWEVNPSLPEQYKFEAGGSASLQFEFFVTV